MTAVGTSTKLLRLIKAYYAFTKTKVRASGSDSLSFNNIIDWILGQALQCYPGFQVGTYVHVSDLAYADDIVLLSHRYTEMQGLLEAVNLHAAVVGTCIKASKAKVMSALIPG